MIVYCVFEFIQGREYDSWDELRKIFNLRVDAQEYVNLPENKYKELEIQEWKVEGSRYPDDIMPPWYGVKAI